MLSAIKRIKLALTLAPAVFFPIGWCLSSILIMSLGATFNNVLVITLEGLVVALLTAYSIVSFVEYLRVLRNGSHQNT